MFNRAVGNLIPSGLQRITTQRGRRKALLPDETGEIHGLSNMLANTELQIKSSKKRCLISLDSTFKKVWDTISTVLLIFTFVYLPIRLTFLLDVKDRPNLEFMELLTDIFFFVDIILNFFTPVINNLETIYAHKEIAKMYLKSWFVPHLLAVVPFEDLF